VNEKLRQQVERQASRLRQAEEDRPTLLGQTVYLGTLGLVFVLPVIFAAYLGNWIDSRMPGYSMRWTLSLLAVGLVVGATNVYLLIRENRDE